MSSNTKIKCYLCGCSDHRQRPGKVRDNDKLQILECQDCGLVFISQREIPENLYEQSGMHSGALPAPEAWLRDTEWDDERRFRSLKAAMTNKDVLDFGCGAGGFIIKAQTITNMVCGVELEERLLPHFKKHKLNVSQKIESLPASQQFDLITAFHVIEHIEEPAQMLAHLSAKLREGGKIIIELPSSADALLTLYNCGPFSEFTYWSCHLYLFNAANIVLLANKAGLHLDYVNHIQRYPLSNHLHWLAKGEPGGHQVWRFMDSAELHQAYESRLAALGITDTFMACFSLSNN